MPGQAKQQLTVWWVSWAALQTAIFAFYHFLGGTGERSQPPAAESAIWLAGLGPVAVSTIIRWLVIPRAPSVQAALALFILGMGLAEVTCFLGLFIFPAHKQELIVLSALGVFQFIPFFARRYFT